MTLPPNEKVAAVLALRGTLPQWQAAAVAGVSLSTWCAWERGRRAMPDWAREAFRSDAAVVHPTTYRPDVNTGPAPVSRAGLTWLAPEIEQLKERFSAGLDVTAMAAAHGRTLYAIVAKLEHLGLVVRIGRGYHAVAPDPWLLDSQLKYLMTEMKK